MRYKLNVPYYDYTDMKKYLIIEIQLNLIKFYNE